MKASEIDEAVYRFRAAERQHWWEIFTDRDGTTAFACCKHCGRRAGPVVAVANDGVVRYEADGTRCPGIIY